MVRDKDKVRGLAVERIRILFDRAQSVCGGDVASASELVRLAHGIGVRCNVPVPADLRRRYCRKCFSYFTSANMRCRLEPKNRRVELKCLCCGYVRMRPYGGLEH